MPYFIHPKDIDIIGEFSPIDDDTCRFFREFTERAQAYAAKQPDERVTYVSTDSDIESWRTRENERFDNGEYLRVPWYDAELSKYRFSHYAHLSLAAPGMVAYTPTHEHGYQDRQVRVKPGRYLEQYYPEQFTKRQIDAYIAQCQAENLTLRIARTPEDISRIYRGSGPGSCMSPGPTSRILRESGLHPCAVYGDSDLGIAYYGDIDAVRARAIVWPDKHTYGRIYGSENGGHVGTNGELLRKLLQDAGYEHGDMTGARIRAIRLENGCYLMPYVDGESYCRKSGDWFVLGEGSTDAQDTSGYVELSGARDDEDDSNDATCDRCGERYDSDDYDAHDDWCASCCEDSFTCEDCNNRHPNDDSHYLEHEGIDLCPDCYRGRLVMCEDADCHTRFIPTEFSPEDKAERERRCVADLCESCAERYEYCDTCNEAYDPSVDGVTCPTCNEHTPRCTQTGDLLADVDTSAVPSGVYMILKNGATRCALPTVLPNGSQAETGDYNECMIRRDMLAVLYPENTYVVMPVLRSMPIHPEFTSSAIAGTNVSPF